MVWRVGVPAAMLPVRLWPAEGAGSGGIRGVTGGAVVNGE